MMKPPPYFQAIMERSLSRWQQLEADPELAAPWHQLFRQVQNPRHVLSELLQNADDAGATKASVTVADHQFVFRHNGHDFSEDELSSLCRFGWSNKRIMHTIGFRGIGFKSTFALGDTVCLKTPTLSVAFDRARFTLPRWADRELSEDDCTQIEVLISDESRESEIKNSMREWEENPQSLLFFGSLHCLRINDREISWESLGPGPASGTEWMALNGDADKTYMIGRSEPEAFPEEALKEVRCERMVMAEEMPVLPPCSVEIVLGGQSRLYNVLPTGTRTQLPFGCNAPFVQDPARFGVQGPDSSDTNCWLLERIGRLAARIMLEWLQNRNLGLSERSQAYALLPDVDRSDTSEEGTISTLVEQSFAKVQDEHPSVLTDTGDVRAPHEAVALPIELFEVWQPDQMVGLFDSRESSVLCRFVCEQGREKLVNWGMVKEVDRSEVLSALQKATVPKPSSWQRLFHLWAYVSPRDHNWWEEHYLTSLRIVPVAGNADLDASTLVVRVRDKYTLARDDDWEFLSSRLRIVDAGWLDFLDKQIQVIDSQQDEELCQRIVAGKDVLGRLGLGQATSVNSVFSQVAHEFFSQSQVFIKDCVRLAQIAARLSVTTNESFRFVTRDNRLRSSNETILFDLDGSVKEIVPESWHQGHLLHDLYSDTFASCTKTEWLEWIASGRSGLNTLVPPEEKKRCIYSRSAIERELRARGMVGAPWYYYRTDSFYLDDWDFDDALWQHWRALAREDPDFWGRLMDRILSQPTSFWHQALEAEAFHDSRNGHSARLTDAHLLPSWILAFANERCLPDIHGAYHRPSELLRRTPATEAMIEVEPFVANRYDQEVNRPLLQALGVRDRPANPEMILRYLRSLANSKEPPTAECEKWYRRLDQLFDASSTADQERIRKAFREERLILLEGGGLAATADVFVTHSEDDVPDAPKVRIAVRDLSFWAKIGVAGRPTIDLALGWLKRLPSQRELDIATLRCVRALLARYPGRIWDECNKWLNLACQWVQTESLLYALTSSPVEWGHLFESIKEKTVDLRMLSEETASKPPFSLLPPLSRVIDERLVEGTRVSVLSRDWPWLRLVGTLLTRVQLEDEAEQETIRGLGRELSQTIVQPVPEIDITPYVEGKPGGTPRRVEVVWSSRVLYVLESSPPQRLARMIPRLLAGYFRRGDITSALSYCYERTEGQITAYFEDAFELLTIADVANPREEGIPGIDTSGVQVTGTDIRTEHPDPTPKARPDSSGDSTQEGSRTENDPNPDRPGRLRPATSPVIERFAAVQGFEVKSDRTFVHPDGRLLLRTDDGIFPWIEKSRDECVYYYPMEHCMEKEPLDVRADVWGMLERFPDQYALILLDLQDMPTRVFGRDLLSMQQTNELKLYATIYRLVISHD